MTALESRYRRLLALLPWEHRRRYEEEMLGVLLDGAAEGQRRPRPAETADLVATAVRLRLRGTVHRLGDPYWADAFAAVGALASIAMVAIGVRRIGVIVGASYAWGWGTPHVGPSDVTRVAVWVLAATAALIGWRWAAAGLAAAGLAAEAAMLLYGYVDQSMLGLQPMAASLVAAAALAVAVVRSSTFRLGPAPVLWALGAGVAVVLERLLDILQSSRPYSDVFVLGLALTAWSTAAWAVSLLLAGASLVALAPAVRRRTLAILTAPLALAAVVRIDPYELFVTATFQAVGLVVVPVAVFVVGVGLVHRREERMRLVDLGRAADRPGAR